MIELRTSVANFFQLRKTQYVILVTILYTKGMNKGVRLKVMQD